MVDVVPGKVRWRADIPRIGSYDLPVTFFRPLAHGSARRLRLRGALLAVVCLGLILGLWGVFVFSYRGQVLEAAALKGSEIGAHYISALAHTVLSVVSIQAAAALVGIILLIGLLRRSHRRAAWAVVAVVGSNLSAQALKYWILWRPDYDISARWDNANTLPSGHTTMATSAAVALILLSGRRWRALSAWAGALFAIAMGYSTLVCQWHRPSDVVTAVLLSVAWGALAVAGGVWDSTFYGAPRERAGGSGKDSDDVVRRAPVPPPLPRLRTQKTGNTLLAVLGTLSTLAAVLLGAWVWVRVDALATRRVLFASYATGSAAVVGITCLAMAALVDLTDWGTARHKRL